MKIELGIFTLLHWDTTERSKVWCHSAKWPLRLGGKKRKKHQQQNRMALTVKAAIITIMTWTSVGSFDECGIKWYKSKVKVRLFTNQHLKPILLMSVFSDVKEICRNYCALKSRDCSPKQRCHLGHLCVHAVFSDRIISKEIITIFH